MSINKVKFSKFSLIHLSSNQYEFEKDSHWSKFDQYTDKSRTGGK